MLAAVLTRIPISMPDMTSDQIRDISIKVVEGFLNDKTPLSEGLAKEASYHGMNPEQIKRAVEASNTITYLKLIKEAEDRTFEFPLCKFDEVMAEIAIPTEKTAAYAKALLANGLISIDEPNLEKKASDESDQTDQVEFSEGARTLLFHKEASALKNRLYRLEGDSEVMRARLLKAASELRSDPAGMDKLSCVAGEDYQGLATLIAGVESPAKRDLPVEMFKEAELKEAKSIVELYKQARQMVAEASTLRELDKKASSLKTELTKKAFVGSIARGIGKGVGSLAGQTISAPVRAFGKTTLNAGKAATGKGTPTPLTLGEQGIVRAAKATGAVAGPGMAYMGYKASGGAGFSNSGRSKDVWDALQS